MTDLHAETKPGHIVFYRGTDYNIQALKKVAKITKTQVVLEGGERYRRSDGKLTGWSGTGWTSSQPQILPRSDQNAARDWARRQAREAKSWVLDGVQKLSDIPEEDEFADLLHRVTLWQNRVRNYRTLTES